MGRTKRWSEDMQARFPEGTFGRIAAVLKPTEDRTEFVRIAVENELAHREAAASTNRKRQPRFDQKEAGMRASSKYDPLSEYLLRQKIGQIVLSFKQIEELIGGELPASAIRPQWWENSTDRNTSRQCRAWLNAGYNAHLIAGSSKVRFERLR